MKSNRHLQVLLAEPFMCQGRESDGYVPHSAALDSAWELVNEKEYELRKRIEGAFQLPFGESGGVISAIAVALSISDLTPARALALAASPKGIRFMRQKVAREEAKDKARAEYQQAEAEGRLVPIRPEE
jgi:hypothetical protein